MGRAASKHATTVYLDPDTYERLRRVAFERRVPMSRVVEDALTTALPAPREEDSR